MTDDEDFAAYAKIVAEHKTIVGETARAELAAHGLHLPPSIASAPDALMSRADTIVVCTTFGPLRPLIHADNQVRMCAWRCGRMIQCRPYVPRAATCVCMLCVASRGGHDH